MSIVVVYKKVKLKKLKLNCATHFRTYSGQRALSEHQELIFSFAFTMSSFSFFLLPYLPEYNG